MRLKKTLSASDLDLLSDIGKDKNMIIVSRPAEYEVIIETSDKTIITKAQSKGFTPI